ncbi:MAG TPA: PQQ-binding-like beta-propeller repeat protein [Lacipirellulaceae bacterium]|nr:PQQ-binding-like beta-propeller repeat protein [Lacipirellulaceae bacterium]
MPVLTTIRECCWPALGAAFISVVTIVCTALGQPVPFGISLSPVTVELTAPHVDTVSAAISGRLEQARALAAAHNWDEAIDIYRELSAGDARGVVAIDQGRYLSLRAYCHLQIARFAPEGLAAYRRRVDPVAEPWYRKGLANRDERLLQRVVDELYCSSWGDDALLALGELALERADYADARHDWEQVSPLLRSPDGLPTWLALRGVDLAKNWPEVQQLWQTRTGPPDWLAYPDTNLNLADVRARLILVSIRAGQLDRAALEFEVFRRLYPNAKGQLGGQLETYAAALERLLTLARGWPAPQACADWPTFAGSLTRSAVAEPIAGVLVPAWKDPIRLTPPAYVRTVRFVQGGADNAKPKQQPEAIVRESQRPLSSYPVVVGDVILFADGSAIHAAQLASGKPAVTADGVLYRIEAAPERTQHVPWGAAGGVARGVPRLTLTAADGVLFARVGSLPTSQPQAGPSSAGDRIIGLDLKREGLLTFRPTREEAGWSFDGAPVSAGDRVFVAMRQSDVTPHAYVACFDRVTGVERWRTSIGAADTPASGMGDEITHNLLTVVGNRIYFNSNLGLVAALQADSGEICWISRYERRRGKTFTEGAASPLYFDRDPSPCAYCDGLVIVAPSDTPTVFAIDAETGKTVWRENQLPDVLQLLGVVDKRLIVSGDRIASLDVASGHIDWIWPESKHAGIRGMGRGIVAGNEIFWPTRDRIYALDVKTGAQTRAPTKIAPLTGGANLAAADARLVLAGYDKLMVLGPPTTHEPSAVKAANGAAAVRTGRLNDRSATK